MGIFASQLEAREATKPKGRTFICDAHFRIVNLIISCEPLDSCNYTVERFKTADAVRDGFTSRLDNRGINKAHRAHETHEVEELSENSGVQIAISSCTGEQSCFFQ